MTDKVSTQGLGGRMVKAALWLVGSNVSSQALRLISSLVLTRLLMPDAFGLLAALSTLYFGLVMFSDMGIWQSVVKSENGNDARFLGTAWAAQLLRAMVLVLLVCLMAVGVSVLSQSRWIQASSVYADPRMPWMMASFSVCALLQGLESMKLATAQRNLHGAYLARLELLSQLAAMGMAVGFAHHAEHQRRAVLHQVGNVAQRAAAVIDGSDYPVVTVLRHGDADTLQQLYPSL